jgi:hypothetical protein
MRYVAIVAVTVKLFSVRIFLLIISQSPTKERLHSLHLLDRCKVISFMRWSHATMHL